VHGLIKVKEALII